MTNLLVAPSNRQIIVWRNPDSHDRHQQDGLMSLLKHHGYCVAALKRESEVMHTVLAAVPDLLIIYLQTSGNRGYEVCSVLRQMLRTRALPIVFIGTRTPASELASALHCGGNEYLQLPLNDEDCWIRLEHQLKTSQLVRSLESERESLRQAIGSYNHVLQRQEAAQLALAQENQALHRLAFIDGLTKIANRSSFSQRILQLWHQAKEAEQPISLLLCDVDYFKRYNDTYGHLAGDACLQVIAAAMVRGAHRFGDQVARYGGEEFAILLPATDSQGAQQVAVTVRSELARLHIPHASSLVKPSVSLSIGVHTLSPRLDASGTSDTPLASDNDDVQLSYKALIHGADEALYAAKAQGRDRAIVYSADDATSIFPGRGGSYSPPVEELSAQPVQLQTHELLSVNA